VERSLDDTALLLEPHIPSLRRYAWALLRNTSDADDLVQDCLERAISRGRMRGDDSNTRAWLFTIMHNLFVNNMRSRARRGVHVPLSDLDDEQSEPAEQEHRLACRDILAALDKLTVEQRCVLLLVGVEDMTYEEAAHVLQIPIGTVMSRLSRGREKLREQLETPRRPEFRRVK
jgi:RNA polymerase sigma factor (sigma-70 family)